MDETAESLALQAMRSFRAGLIAEGGRQYRRALETHGGNDMPVRRHVQLLEGTGLDEAAALVLRAGLSAGADLSSGLLARDGDPYEAVDEYEALFAKGIANARMMSDYLVALSRTGASDKLAAAMDPARLFRKTLLDIPDDREAFLDRVSRALVHSHARSYQTANKSIRDLERVPETERMDDPDVIALHAAVRRQIAEYINEIAASDHMIAPWVYREFDLHSWAVISEDAGFSAPHIHGGCWVVAVAYVAGDDENAAATLTYG